MDKEVFRERIYGCLEESIKEINWQIDKAIEDGIYEKCDERKAGVYGDVKAILYEVLKSSADLTVGKPCLPSSVKRFNQMSNLFVWRFFH